MVEIKPFMKHNGKLTIKRIYNFDGVHYVVRESAWGNLTPVTWSETFGSYIACVPKRKINCDDCGEKIERIICDGCRRRAKES